MNERTHSLPANVHIGDLTMRGLIAASAAQMARETPSAAADHLAEVTARHAAEERHLPTRQTQAVGQLSMHQAVALNRPQVTSSLLGNRR